MPALAYIKLGGPFGQLCARQSREDANVKVLLFRARPDDEAKWINNAAGSPSSATTRSPTGTSTSTDEDGITGLRLPFSSGHSGRLELDQRHALCARPAARL